MRTVIAAGAALMATLSVFVQTTALGHSRVKANAEQEDAARLFKNETFGGNGRTCSTCHRAEDGFSTTPATAQQRFAADRKDPLFRPVYSDDGVGTAYTRLLAHATIRVEIPLNCPNIWLEDDPTAKSVVLNRAIPDHLNTAGARPDADLGWARCQFGAIGARRHSRSRPPECAADHNGSATHRSV